jgi:hypothetical protein
MAKKIKVNIYDDMRQSLADALVYEGGQKVDLRVTEDHRGLILSPRQVAHLALIRVMRFAKLPSAPRTDQLAVSPLPPHP